MLAALARLAPSGRSLAVGFGILGLALGAYAVARETSIFAVDTIDVRGGGTRIDAQVRKALAPELGRSLVGLDGAAVVRRADALPTVVRVSYDRAFPHTLRLTVVPERPVAVVRSGAKAWLVSVRGRVIEPLSTHAMPGLPRIWLPTSQVVRPGELLPSDAGGMQARTLGLAGSFASRVSAASFSRGALVFRLRSGLQLVLGDPAAIRLKVAVAARALVAVPSGSTYLDVSVPGRAVSGTGSPLSTASKGSSRG